MARILINLVFCGALLITSAWPGRAARQAYEPQTERTPGARPLPLHRFRWSRQAQQDKEGFYRQAVALCDDYPTESRTEEKVRRDLEAMRGTGASLLRCGIAWESIEHAPGHYDWKFWDMLVAMAARYHVTLIPYVCYTPQWLAVRTENFWREPPRDLKAFSDFVYAIVSRYRGKVHSWELWNEPDNPEFWQGTVDQFAQMIQEGAQAVRRADPQAVIVLGGMAATHPTPFFEKLKSQYQIEDYVDVVNIHCYNETWSADLIERLPDQITAMSNAVQRSAGTPDLWLAEFGYSDYRFKPAAVSQGGVPVYYDYEHTPAYQGTALFKMYVQALATGRLSLTAWYRINDLEPSQTVIGDDNNKFLGLLDLSGRPKPAFYALKFYNHLFDQPARCIDASVQIVTQTSSQAVVHCFEKRNGQVIIAAWLRSSMPGEVTDRSGQASDLRRETLAVRFAARHSGSVRYYHENGEEDAGPSVLEDQAIEQITLTGGRLFIAVITPRS